MSERTRAEVKKFVLERIEQWLCTMIEQADSLPEQQTMWDLREDIRDNKMLYKEQADILNTRLDNECRQLSKQRLDTKGNYLLVLDELSIYTDAWAIYCRPGTYMVII